MSYSFDDDLLRPSYDPGHRRCYALRLEVVICVQSSRLLSTVYKLPDCLSLFSVTSLSHTTSPSR